MLKLFARVSSLLFDRRVGTEQQTRKKNGTECHMKHFTSDDRTVSREFNQTVHNSHAPRGRLECSRLFADAVEKNNANT